MKNGKKELLRRLDAAQHCAESGRLGRFLAAPWRYFSTMYFLHYSYPRKKEGKFVTATPFFGLPMRLVLPSGADIYITGAKSHSSELRLARYMVNQLKSGHQVLDVGAHLGYFTLLAARLVGEKGRVVAVEAAKSTYDILAQNVDKQPFVSVMNCCLSDSDEEQTFYEFPILYNEYNTLLPAQFEQQDWQKKNPPRAVQVQGLTLTQLIEQTGLRPDFIKIDVEGAEDKVIAGAAAWLTNLPFAQRPTIVLEYLAADRQNQAHQKAKELLESFGYTAFIIDKKGKLKACEDIETYLLRQQLDSDNVVFSFAAP